MGHEGACDSYNFKKVFSNNCALDNTARVFFKPLHTQMFV